MQSEGSFSKLSLTEKLKVQAIEKWEQLSDKQKLYAKKAWGIITYKWKWQIAINIPYLAIFLLDRSVPQVHQFNMHIISLVLAKVPVPEYITSIMGIN